MNTKSTLVVLGLAVSSLAGTQVHGQNTQPFWSLAGNSNSTLNPAKLGTTNGTSLGLYTSNLERIRITNGGNIGIGTGSPLSRLAVNVPTGTTPFRTVINGATKFMVHANGGVSVGTGVQPVANGLFVNYRVGIGTSTAATRLDILGGNWDVANTEGDIRVGNATYRLKIGVATGGLGAGDARIRAVGGTNRIIIGANDALAVDGNGNVGIGTIFPATRLDVRRSDGAFVLAKFTNAAAAGDRTALIDIQNGNITPALWRYGVGGTGNGLGLAAGQFYIERAGAGAFMVFSHGGNVGIGTNNPLYKLSVNGTIQAKELRVETGWADFVFEEGYRLRPLSEVADYIARHKHLPDMPSAKEIADNGLEVAAMNTLMMQKIEELTLYVIRQEAEIKALSNELKKAKQRKARQ